MSTKRAFLYALAGLASAVCMSPALAQTSTPAEICTLLRGKTTDYEYRLNASGTVTAKAPGFTIVIRSKCVRFEADYYDISSGTPVAKFAPPASAPSVEPVQRVTIEYASGRREVVP